MLTTYRSVLDGTPADRQRGKYHDWPEDYAVQYSCRWEVIAVRDGVVTWKCLCGNRMARKVR